MAINISRVAVIGSGTMGAGIAGVCAAAGTPVMLADMEKATAEKAIERLTGGRKPVLTEEQASLIKPCSIDDELADIGQCDWICEVIIENLAAKRELFAKLEPHRKENSIVTSNTSGIPLRDIYADMPEQFRRDVAITHFFNPVHIMRLLELVPGEDTDAAVIETLVGYLGGTLGKGIVYAKDTVNFIGNRIGCYWMLCGLSEGIKSQEQGLTIETIDALLSKPVGLPPTGLYGLVDLIGLDIMDLVAKNLRENLPAGDDCERYLDLPTAEQAMLADGQLGRKTGGGYYKMLKDADGNKSMEVFDLTKQQWRPMQPAEALDDQHSLATNLLFANTAEGQFAWQVMSNTLAYAAGLVPQIADDIVNIDRAMRWGFNWQQGPFELLDAIGNAKFADKLKAENRQIPKMLQTLLDAGETNFYKGDTFFTTEGTYSQIPAE